MNGGDLRAFFHLNYLSVRYFVGKWKELLKVNKKECYKNAKFNTGEMKPTILPNFSAVVEATMVQVNKVLSQ